MTASSSTGQAARFLPLEQADFQRLEHAGYLKGLYSLLRVRESGHLGQPMHGAARRLDRPGAAARAATGARLSLLAARRATGPADHWRRHDLPPLAQPRSFLNGRGAVGITARPPRDAGLADRRPVRDGAAAHRAEHADQPSSHAGPPGPGVRQQGRPGRSGLPAACPRACRVRSIHHPKESP